MIKYFISIHILETNLRTKNDKKQSWEEELGGDGRRNKKKRGYFGGK